MMKADDRRGDTLTQRRVREPERWSGTAGGEWRVGRAALTLGGISKTDGVLVMPAFCADDPSAWRDVDSSGRNYYHLGMKAIVSEKGQVTIPKPLRTRLGLKHGAVIEFEADGGRLVGRKASAESPVDSVWGILDLGEAVDVHIERIRGR